MSGEVRTWEVPGESSDTLRLGWIQMDIHWENPEVNIAAVEKLLREAGAQAEVWVLPEMWATGFSVSAQGAESEPGLALSAMQRWASSCQALLIGSLKVQARDGHLYNRAYAVSPNGMWNYYDKHHLFRMAGEEKIFTSGTHRLIIFYLGWRIAVLICYDLRFPVWSRRTAAYDYDLLIYVANWPAVRAAHWQKLLPARSIENQAYVLGVNRTGTDGTGKSYTGGSALYGPQGEELLHSGESQGPWWTTLSRESLEKYRAAFPAWQDSELFELV